MRTALISLCGLLPFVSLAQRDKDTITNREVKITYDYQPKFMNVQKIESVPVIDKPYVKPALFTYQIKAHQVNTEKVIKPMPVADLNSETENTYPNSFVKLGYGNLKTPLAEIYLNNKQNTRYSYGAHYRFLQTNSDLNNSFADFSRHNFKAYASNYTENGELGVELNYKQENYFYYGYNTVDSPLLEASRDKLARNMSTFDARAYYNSTATGKKKLKHRSQFNFYRFGIDDADESQYAFSSLLYAGVPNFDNLSNCKVSAVLGVDYNIFNNDTLAALKRFFIQFDPRFDFTYDGLQISAGFNTSVFFKDKAESEVFLNPVIKVNYPLLPNVANLYAGIDGRYHKQSLRSIINANPYTSQYDLTNMYENVRSYLGLNAKMGSSADAVFEITYANVTNMPLFVSNDTSIDRLNSFSIFYKQVDMLKFMAAFNYSFSEHVRIGLLGNFYNYEVNEEPYPWQLPNIDGKVNMRFNIANKLYPHFDLVAMGVQKQRSGTGKNYSTNSIDAFYDISAGVDYRFKSKLSAFVQANNLMGTRYQRWYNYPVYGFNILGGITMIF